MINASDASEDLTKDLIDVDDALAELKGNVDERTAWRNLINEIEDAGDAARKAFEETTPEALRASEQALDDARLKVGEYVAEMETIPEDKKTEIIASLDNANLAEVERILDNLARARQIPFMPSVRPGAGGINEIGSGGRPIGEAPIGFSYRPTVPSMTLNVQGSVVTEGDLLRSIRQGLANSQKSGNSLVYSNT
jgi:vacuolar-type H+-ATPase subunit H